MYTRGEGKDQQTVNAVMQKPPAGSPWRRRDSHEKGLRTRRQGGAAGEEVEVGDEDMEPETEL